MTSILLLASGDGLEWLLPFMVLLPLFGGFALALAPGDRPDVVRGLALGLSTLVFALSLGAAFAFDWSDPGRMQLGSRTDWVGELGVSLGFGTDSISLYLILLTTFLMPLTILGSFGDLHGEKAGRHREFYLWLLVLEAALIGVFAATDLILFFICFELTLVPLYFLIGIFGSTQRHYAAIKFFLFTLTGSIFTFATLIYVAWWQTTPEGGGGAWTFDIDRLVAAAQSLSATQQGWVLAGLLVGFAVKVPLFPVHTWLPLAHTEAPTSGSVILAGVLLKLGTYGLLRFAVPMAPMAVAKFAPEIAVISIIGILYAALICWVQSDIKKLVAYSSVSHLGFCVLGLVAL
ncbi:MAG: NADH-quinone oxidoreductase subunit M, partial [Phycisphaerae bacterium]|nr:NADH-quinone oxidoreductase subunit M [Phycisphaerae bacterium]